MKEGILLFRKDDRYVDERIYDHAQIDARF